MSKKSTSPTDKKTSKPSPKKSAPKPRLSAEEREQRESLDALELEILELSEISLDVMEEKGILPPLYGGEHLGEGRELIPLWGFDTDKDEPLLGIMLLRLMEDTEPDEMLVDMREMLGIENDWPVSELLDTIFAEGERHSIEGLEKVEGLNIFLVLGGEQIAPAPGYEREEMLAHIAGLHPYALFPIIPTSGEGEMLNYEWDDIENFRAEVVYAETPQLLEAAVWDYRLRVALEDEVEAIAKEGGKPDEELIATSARDLVGTYDLLVMGVQRLYGSTSPIRAQQEKLDVLRAENGDLYVPLPLKVEIEPVSVLGKQRIEVNTMLSSSVVKDVSPLLPMPYGLVLVHMKGDSENFLSIWPKVRASRFFGLRMRTGILTDVRGQLRVSGYYDDALFEWVMAETLLGLQRILHLFSLRELLTLCEVVKSRLVHYRGKDNPD